MIFSIKSQRTFFLCLYSLSQSNTPFAQQVALLHDSGNGGFVQYELNGNPSEYNYYWTHGATELTLSGLPVGTYTLVVQDLFGCVQEFEVTILLADACMLNYETSNGEPCTEVLILEVVFNGIPISESDLEITWEDGDPSGLTRVVSTQTGGTYCVSVSAPNLGVTCQSLEHCFELSAEVCPVDECKLFFTVNTDRDDRCKKIINALVMQDGRLCEDDYEGYWEVECEPEVTIEMDENNAIYTIDLVNPNDTSLKTISLNISSDGTQVDMTGRFIVKENFGNLLLDELKTNSAQILFGSKTLQYAPIVDGGFLDSVKIRDTDGNIFYIPLSPSTAMLNGVAGSIISNDLIFNSNDVSLMRTALEDVTHNFLATKGYTNHENYKLLYIVSPSGTIGLRFFAKHQPSEVWLGIKKDDRSLHYHSDANNSFESNSLDTYGIYNHFIKVFNTPCGIVKILVTDLSQVEYFEFKKTLLGKS